MEEGKQVIGTNNFNNSKIDIDKTTLEEFKGELSESANKRLSIRGTSVTGLIFTLSIILTFVGFILSLISVFRGVAKKKKNTGAKIKGLSMSIVSLVLSIIIIVSSVAIPIFFRYDIISIADDNLSEHGCTQKINDILQAELSVGHMDICLQIEKSLSVNEIDKAVALSDQLGKPLTKEEKYTVMNALVQRINNRMRTFLNSFGSQDCLISNDIIEEIDKYQKIVNNVGVTSSDNTNVSDYLTQVSNLRMYSKYNDYWSYYYETIDDWNSANQYWEYACDSYSDYLISENLYKALNHFNICLSTTYNYSSSNFGILEARDFLQLYVDKINYYFSTGNDMTIDYSIVSAFESISNEFTIQSREFLNKIESLPTSVYYN